MKFLSPFQLYLLGLFTIVLGAWGMDATGSMWPMAFGAATGVMLARPLVAGLLGRFLRRR